MRHPNNDPYARNREVGGKHLRVVAQIPKEEIQAVDSWGVSAGMESRSAAIRALLRKGLGAVGVTTSEAQPA